MFFEIPKDRLLEVYLTQEFENKYEEVLKDYSYELVSENVLKALSDTQTPQGVFALVKRQEMKLDEILGLEQEPCFFLLENLQDPGNLGTIIRTSEGAGVTGILITKDTVDPYNPKVIRSTMGAIFRLPIVVIEDMDEVLAAFKERGITSYAAHLGGSVFYDYDYRKGCVFFIGNEGNGLSEELTARADCKIKIPMMGQVESLNAAVASTVLMYEMMRQRYV